MILSVSFPKIRLIFVILLYFLSLLQIIFCYPELAFIYIKFDFRAGEPRRPPTSVREPVGAPALRHRRARHPPRSRPQPALRVQAVAAQKVAAVAKPATR